MEPGWGGGLFPGERGGCVRPEGYLDKGCGYVEVYKVVHRIVRS